MNIKKIDSLIIEFQYKLVECPNILHELNIYGNN